MSKERFPDLVAKTMSPESIARAHARAAELLAASWPAPSPHSGLTFAPWTVEQVALLNNYQTNSAFHPFTCRSGTCAHVTLVAEADGWHCPSCDYTQGWAHNFMTRPWRDPRP